MYLGCNPRIVLHYIGKPWILELLFPGDQIINELVIFVFFREVLLAVFFFPILFFS